MWRKVVYYLVLIFVVMLVFLLLALASGLSWRSICIVFGLVVGWVALIVITVNMLYELAKWADIT